MSIFSFFGGIIKGLLSIFQNAFTIVAAIIVLIIIIIALVLVSKDETRKTGYIMLGIAVILGASAIFFKRYPFIPHPATLKLVQQKLELI